MRYPTSKSPDPVTTYARRVLAGKVIAGRLVRAACARHMADLARQTDPAFQFYFDPARAKHVVAFFRDFLTLDDGQPFILMPWLQFVFGSLEGWREKATGDARFQTSYLETSKGTGKALALDTPIPTPTGWTTMGDLAVGDLVFDERGRPVSVVGVSDVMTGHLCSRVVFDDGSSLVADDEHLWRTEARRQSDRHDRGFALRGVPLAQRGAWKIAVRTTREIKRTLSNSNGRSRSANHSIALAGPLALPQTTLPIEPYTFGVWLGDGDSDGGRVTIADHELELIDHLMAVGATVGPRQGPPEKTGRYRVLTAPQLRATGALANKHIPQVYLRASVEQRLALLQGLMDTDGCIDPKRGGCSFTTTASAVATGMVELLVSLGIKATAREGRATLYGRDVSAVWDIYFMPPSDLPVFRLRRKAQYQRVRHARRRLSGDRRIVAVDSVASVPVRCIRVDTPSHLYLAGRAMVPTHNTPAAAGYGLYALAGKNEQNTEVYSLGVTGDQASYLFKFAKRMVERSDDLQSVIDVGEHNLASPTASSFFRPLSAEGRSLDNKRPYLALVDELHEHPSAVIPEKMRLGFKGRRDALLFEITNAGFDTTSVCWDHHDYSVKILDGIITGPAADRWFAYVCQLDPCAACRDAGATVPSEGCATCDHWTDSSVWLKVNPSLGVTITIPQMQALVSEALDRPAAQARIKRLNFCLWTQSHTVWIPHHHWDACRVAAVSTKAGDRSCAVGFDMSMKLDLTACVLAVRVDDAEDRPADVVELTDVVDGVAVRKTLNLDWSVELIPYFWLPEETLRDRVRSEQIPFDLWQRAGELRSTPGPVIDYDLIFEEFTKAIAPPFRPQRIGYDPHNATQFAVQLRDKARFEVAEVKQGRALSESFKLFEAMVRAKRIRHSGNRVLGWCVSNAAPKYDRYENLWLEKPSATKRIDGVIAAVIALNQLVLLPAKRRKPGRPMLYTPGGFIPMNATP